nr:uncharacterized protein LOC113696754 [Coffea arabica]
MDWNEDCQQAFDMIKNYLLNPPILVPPQPRRPLIMYLSILDEAIGCVLRQRDESGRKEQAIYYLSKKFTAYEANYSFLERSCCALAWVALKLRHYLLGYTMYLILRSDPLKYLLEKSMSTGRMAKWQMILSDFNIIFTTQKAVKVEDMSEQYSGWRLFFDGVSNAFGAGIGAVLVSPEGKHYPATAKLRFPCTNNMAEYEACIFGLKMALDMEIKDLIVFTTLSSMIQHPDELVIEPIQIQLQDRPTHCLVMERVSDVRP